MTDDNDSFDLECSFWIDTDAYSQRDRDMFVCGAEFMLLYTRVTAGEGWKQPIHVENESRVRMLCGKLRLPCQIVQFCDTWSECEIAARSGHVDEDSA